MYAIPSSRLTYRFTSFRIHVCIQAKWILGKNYSLLQYIIISSESIIQSAWNLFDVLNKWLLLRSMEINKIQCNHTGHFENGFQINFVKHITCTKSSEGQRSERKHMYWFFVIMLDITLLIWPATPLSIRLKSCKCVWNLK